jgi:hypothetical protein
LPNSGMSALFFLRCARAVEPEHIPCGDREASAAYEQSLQTICPHARQWCLRLKNCSRHRRHRRTEVHVKLVPCILRRTNRERIFAQEAFCGLRILDPVHNGILS